MEKKKLFLVGCLLCCLLVLVSKELFITENTRETEISFPSIDIQINEKVFTAEFNREHVMFPLFMYNKMLYYPLTEESKKLLKISEMTSKDTNIIQLEKEDEVVSEYRVETVAFPNNENKERNLTAIISDKNLIMGEEIIASNSMQYPILEYQKVFYMPLTKEFVIDIMKGSYYWNEDGLVIIFGV